MPLVFLGFVDSWVWLKIKQGGQTAGFGPCFHLPGFHFGTGFLSHGQLELVVAASFIQGLCLVKFLQPPSFSLWVVCFCSGGRPNTWSGPSNRLLPF